MPTDYPASVPFDLETEPTWILLDPGAARYIEDVLRCLLGAAVPPSAEQIAHALHGLQQGIRDSGGRCPVCWEPWHYAELCHEPDEPEPPTKFAPCRLLSDEGRVLYVGVSRNLRGRLAAHRRNWGHLFTDVIVEYHESAEAMLEAEAQAIREEQPPLNSDGLDR